MKEQWRIAVAAHGIWLMIASVAFAFALSLLQILLPVLLILVVVAWWLNGSTGSSIDIDSPLPWMAMLYAMHILGMAWSTNMEYGLFDLQIKLPLLFLPLLGMFRPRDTRSMLVPVGAAFLCGNVIAVLAGLVHIMIVTTGVDALPLEGNLFGPAFSFLMHSSYFSMQLVFALAIYFFTGTHQQFPNWMSWIIAPLLCVGIILSGSKIGWLTMPLVLLWILGVRWRDARIRSQIVTLITLGALVIGALLMFSPLARDRVKEISTAILRPEVHADAATSTEIRKLAWSGAAEVIGNNTLIGTGTGDVKDELIAVYIERGYEYLVLMRINAHNQFLQMFAALGIIGVVLTLAILLVPLFISWRRSDHLACVFFVLCALNWSVESMLEVQAGVMFFAFLALLLSSSAYRSSPHDTIQSATHR